MSMTRQQVGYGALLAGVSAVIGVISSFFALYSQVEIIAKPYILSFLRQYFAPVGTVISSILHPKLFAEAIGENEGDEFPKRKWILSDGSTVLGTEFARKTGNKPVPDLRGLFLRGIDTRSNNRVGGDFEDFSTARPKLPFKGSTSTDGGHSHYAGMAVNPAGDRYSAGGAPYPASTPIRTSVEGDHKHTFEVTSGGDDETRPKNVAVYYYIKIN